MEVPPRRRAALLLLSALDLLARAALVYAGLWAIRTLYEVTK